jgi:hypothetical protein
MPNFCITTPRLSKSFFLTALLMYATFRQNLWQFSLVGVLLAIAFFRPKNSFKPLPKKLLLPMVFAVSFGSVFAAIQPAHALFFGTAEAFFATKFGAIPGFATTLGLSVNVMRGLFVLYILWSYVKIVEAKNSGQDASQLFQTLFITILAGFFGDEVLKLFI